MDTELAIPESSNLSRSTLKNALIVQLVERNIGIVEVMDSISVESFNMGV